MPRLADNLAEIGPLLPGVARRAIASWLSGDGRGSPRAAGPRAPVFVTLRGQGGALRGCVGSLVPSQPDIFEETARSAVMAATQDPRFGPVTADELPALSIEVSVLEPEERVAGPEDLEPGNYGVVVRDTGGRQGILLPGIDGVDDPRVQLEFARRKAGIAPGAPVTIARFRVTKWIEQGLTH